MNLIKKDRKIVKFYKKEVDKIIRKNHINKDDICEILFYYNYPEESFPLWTLNIQIITLDKTFDEMFFLTKLYTKNIKTTYNRLKKGIL